MKSLEKEAVSLFKEIMKSCKTERRAKSKLTNKDLAKALDITENYVSALENARAVPSVNILLKYLIACGFDVDMLKELSITDSDALKPRSKERLTLIQRIYSFDDEQVGFLLEQAKIAEALNLRIKPKKS